MRLALALTLVALAAPAAAGVSPARPWDAALLARPATRTSSSPSPSPRA